MQKKVDDQAKELLAQQDTISSLRNEIVTLKEHINELENNAKKEIETLTRDIEIDLNTEHDIMIDTSTAEYLEEQPKEVPKPKLTAKSKGKAKKSKCKNSV